MVEKLSTQKNRKNVEKWGFPQISTLPHSKWEKRGITGERKKNERFVDLL